MEHMKKALLVIDMQQDLCLHPKRQHKVRQMMPSLLKTIDLFYRHNLPVYYICFALEEEDAQFKRFGDRYCIKGSEGAKIIEELYPLRGAVIFKKKHSAFFETDLHQKLKEDGVQEIYLTGMQTQICIMTTAADANFRGYTPIAIRECVLSTRDTKKNQALKWISDYVGEVQSLTELLHTFDHEKG